MPQASFAHILVMAKRLALTRLLLSFGGDAFGYEFDSAVNLIAERPPTSGKRRQQDEVRHISLSRSATRTGPPPPAG
jgi:hypothetical protein